VRLSGLFFGRLRFKQKLFVALGPSAKRVIAKVSHADEERASKCCKTLSGFAQKIVPKGRGHDQKEKPEKTEQPDNPVFVFPAPHPEGNNTQGNYQPKQHNMERFLAKKSGPHCR
jgi:hypothetical protein